MILIIASCSRKEIDCIRPYTAKEISFVDSLKKQNLKVELSRFNYGYMGGSLDACMMYLTGTYSISINNYDFDKINNLDTIREVARQLAIEVFSNVIEDIDYVKTDNIESSVLKNTDDINVLIQSKKRKEVDQFGNRFTAIFLKSDLEEYLRKEVDSLRIDKEYLIK